MANRLDTFDRADSGPPLGTPSGGGAAWEATKGSFVILSNRAANATAGTHDVTVLEASAADAEVQVTLAAFADQMGLAFRLTDLNNFFFVRTYSGAGYDLFRFEAGGSSHLGAYATTPASGDVLKAVCSGSSLSVYVNGTLRIGPVTDAFNGAATKHGLWAYSAGGANRFDDFSITDLGGGGGGAAPPRGRRRRNNALRRM